MSSHYNDFQRRVGRIHKEHGRRGARAYVLRSDGLVVARSRTRLRLPWRALVTSLVAAVLVKAAMITALGVAGYEARITTLLEGATYQDTATMILMPDRMSLTAADLMGRAVGALTGI